MKMSKLVPLLLFAWFSGASAAAILDLAGEDLLRQATELRPQLKLTALQLPPWLQAESRTREILREQRARRERFQIELKEDINRGQFSVAGMFSRIEAEDTVAQEERRLLRQIWGSVFKGLDGSQESQLREFVRVLLEAPPSTLPTPPPAPSSAGPDDQSRQRSGRGGKMGGMGGGLGGGMPRF